MAEYSAPLPKPTPDTFPFWEGLKAHELRIQRCRACSKAYFYPRNVCPHCLSGDVEWFRASGRGKLHTFVVNHTPGKNFPLPAPYVIAIVELEEGPRMLANLIGIEPDPANLHCDMPVVIEYADVTGDFTLPHFRPAA